MAGTRRATLREASEELGVSVEAVRKRVKRGSLESDKGPDGRVYVYLDAGGDASHPRPEVESSEASLVEELRRQNDYLREQLDAEREARTEERRRHDTLLAQLMQRIPELEPPAQEESAEDAETVEEAPEGSEPRSTAPGAHSEATGARRPWWRRVFGG